MFKKIASVKTGWLTCILLLSLFIALVLVDRASSSSGTLIANSDPQPAAVAQGQSASRKGQLVRVWVHGDDIYPSVAHVRPGRVLLVAENQTQSDISLVVERVSPGQARQNVARISTVRKAIRVDGEFTLGAGEYVLYEETQPDVKGTIFVQPD